MLSVFNTYQQKLSFFYSFNITLSFVYLKNLTIEKNLREAALAGIKILLYYGDLDAVCNFAIGQQLAYDIGCDVSLQNLFLLSLKLIFSKKKKNK